MINLRHLKTLSKGNTDFISEILQVYLTNAPRDFEELKSSYEARDMDKVCYLAHKLKSSTFTVGFDEGYKIFQEIECILKEGKSREKISALIEKANSACSQSIVEVKIELAKFL